MKNKNIYQSEFYATGQYWIFNNGQYGEKTAIMQRDFYEIMTDEKTGKELGLYHYKANNTGNSHFDGSLFSIGGLSGKRLDIYNELKARS